LKPPGESSTRAPSRSRPVRARGLKPTPAEFATAWAWVAPRAGAWVETTGSGRTASGHPRSRPVRARGLKHSRDVSVNRGDASRPVRARGLKLGNTLGPVRSGLSRPVRARGLKHRVGEVRCTPLPVAPRAGAWVETASSTRSTKATTVAPRAGAWVETQMVAVTCVPSAVAPRAGAWVETASFSRTCTATTTVAPRAGAWVETLDKTRDQSRRQSRPVRARGLKRQHGGERGKVEPVAPRAGAWVETSELSLALNPWLVAPRAGAWVETTT